MRGVLVCHSIFQRDPGKLGPPHTNSSALFELPKGESRNLISEYSHTNPLHRRPRGLLIPLR